MRVISKLSSVYFSSLKPPYAVVGLGVTGLSVIKLLRALGVAESQIISFDEKDPAAQVSNFKDLLSKNPGSLFVSPGVPLSLPWISKAKSQGVQISSELSLAFSFLTQEKVIGITGSVGKSTTTSLLGAAAATQSKFNFAGGNLGDPLANYIDEVLSKGRKRADWIILELSSYQLENFENLSCEFSAITYLTANHLERYPSINEYYETKLQILEKTKNIAVLNNQGGDLKTRMLGRSSKARIEWTDRESAILKNPPLKNAVLLGSYNQDNLAVAARLAELAGWGEPAFKALAEFRGLPHRLENLGEVQRVKFVNDSKATTMESVIQATQTVIETVPSTQKLFLLLGGHDKGLPWGQLGQFNKFPNLQPVYFGEFGQTARDMVGIEGKYFKTLSALIKELPKMAKPGDTVLLSPGGTSHDEFKNFEERGNFFRSAITQLKF